MAETDDAGQASWPNPQSVDWSLIEDICEERAVTLDRNDPDFITSVYRFDRDRLARQYPIEHKPNCNLHPSYSKDPKTWARGCDCGATERAAQQRPNGK